MKRPALCVMRCAAEWCSPDLTCGARARDWASVSLCASRHDISEDIYVHISFNR